MSGVSRTRYAIGLADIPRELVGALEELAIGPKSVYPLKAIACREPLSRAFQSWISQQRDPRACEWVVTEPAATECPWRFEIFRPIQHPGPGVGVNPLPGFPVWVLNSHMRALDQHLRTGGGLLVVQNDTDAAEKAAWKTLLRNCSGLITYDAL
jgi:hypothetical protein